MRQQKNAIKQSMVDLRKHRGMNDVLSYLMMLDDSTLLHKDGALSRHFIFVTPDLTSSLDHEWDYHAKTWQNGFNFLGDGWMVEVNAMSKLFHPDRQSQEFPDVVSALIDDERRLQYDTQHYFQTTYYLSLTWKPEKMIASRLRYFAVNADSASSSVMEVQLETFNQTIKDYLGYLQRSLLSIRPLQDNEMTTFLHQCITGSDDKLAKPHMGSFADVYLAEEFIGGFKPKVGNRWTKVLAIDDVPSYAYPAILDAINYFPMPYRWSSRFICLDQQTARSYLKRYERNWSSKAIGAMGALRESMGMPIKLDNDAQQMAGELRRAQQDVSAGNVGNGFYNSVLVLMHEDPIHLSKMGDAIAARIRQLDFKVREESINATEAYLGSLPGHGDYNLRKMLVDTEFVSCALPISSIYQGASQSPCKLPGYHNQPALLLTTTDGRRPFHLNLHLDDVGHTAILGPTGSGKTTLLSALMAAHRKYVDSRLIVLDKDYSNRILIKVLNGNYYDLSKNECQLSPLSRVAIDNIEAIDQAVLWLAECCTVHGIAMTPARQKELREAVTRLAAEEVAYKNLNHLSLQDSELRETISVLNSGSFQQLLNGTETAFSHQDVIGIDISHLLTEGRDARFAIPVIKAILDELGILFKDKRPTLLILEEAWLYLKHPLFRAMLIDWLKTLRKFNVAVIFISQDLDDIVKSDAASVIQTSCMTRIYLPNAAAVEPHIADQYRAFGLNNTEIDIIHKSVPKRDYYYQSSLGNRLFQLDLGPLALAFLGVSQKQEILQFEAIYKRDNPAWVLEWLNFKGLDQWQDYARSHYFGDIQ